MMLSGSERKRVGGAPLEDTFENPEFDRHKNYQVREAELEHVSAKANVETQNKRQQHYSGLNLLQDQISAKLVIIDGVLKQIKSLTDEIEDQEHSIKNLIDKYDNL